MIRKKIRHIWHEVFYFRASRARIEFGLSCREASHHVDLRQTPENFVDRFRLRLHLSFCQACKDYLDVTKALRRAIRSAPKKDPVDLNRLKFDLLEKYSAQTIHKKNE